MKSKTTILYAIFFFFLGTVTVFSQKDVKYKISPGKSLVKWNAKKVTGEHSGLINVKHGYVLGNGTTISGGTVFINMQSIVNLDLEDENDKKKLIEHLKSEDFFNTKKFGEAIFKIYQLTPLKDQELYTHSIEGSLTLKGRTHPLTFPIKVEYKKDKIYIEGQTEVDRTLYDIRYGSGKFFDNLGDNLIYDTFTIDFNIMATPPEAGK